MKRLVKIGGRPQADPKLAAALAGCVRAGDTLCVVHGGGDAVTALQRRLGTTPQFIGGRRVTTAEDFEIVRMVLSGATNKQLVTRLLAEGIPAVGISGEDAGLLRARITDPQLGRVGGDVRVDARVVACLMEGGFVPVVSPLAGEMNGGESGLNVNGDDAAAALGAALGVDDLVLVADVEGVLVDGIVVPTLDADQAAALVQDGAVTGGMIAKLEAGLLALRGGARRVRIAGIPGISDADAGTHLQLQSAAGRRVT